MSISGICIYMLLCIQSAVGAVTQTTSTSTPVEALTCPSRTINYLTHTLPKQCLPSVRTAALNSTRTDNSTITSAAVSSTTTNTEQSIRIREVPASSQSTEVQNVQESSSVHSSSPSSQPTSIHSVTTVLATPLADAASVALLPSVVEEDSPLESGNFLSFEEWKKRNLIKAGQSEHLGRSGRSEPIEPHKRPANVHNTLDSLGDDAEIDLDFSGLVPGGPDAAVEYINRENNYNSGTQETKGSGSKLGARARSKDAGTTCKERFNYASLDCAASILKTNPEAKSPNTVLMENKDSYMLNKCSAKNKFIILELCDDIAIDTIVVANFEFFSSSFRTFRVSVSDKYPVKPEKWRVLGDFEARNTREVQAFLVENPLIWAHYVRIEFLTHYGSEFYCPVSLVRVHGTTMMEDYKHDLDMSMEDDEDESEDATLADVTESQISHDVDGQHVDEKNLSTTIDNHTVDILEVQTNDVSTSQINASDEDSDEQIAISPNRLAVAYDELSAETADVCVSSDGSPTCTFAFTEKNLEQETNTSKHVTTSTSAMEDERDKHTSVSVETRLSTTSALSKIQSSGNVPPPQKENSSGSSTKTSNEGRKSIATGSEHIRSNATSQEASRSQSSKQPSTVSSQAAAPTMQDSFFKSVQKRLQMLESNSSLSLQYIEEQSRTLRDAFRKVEQRQLSKTTLFLEHLNQTVLNELREFRQQYDQLWQSTVIELEIQRERYQQESQAMHARLGILADELIFQRRVSMLQMLLILVCLGLILFSRGSINAYLELPLVQSVLSRSPSSKWMNGSVESHGNSPAMTRSRSGHQLGAKQGILKSHRRGTSEDSNIGAFSASELYSPPTPVSYDGFSDAELVKLEPKLDDPDFDPIHIERPNTSPPVLPSVEDPSTPRSLYHPDDTSIESRLLTPEFHAESPIGPEVKIEQPTPPGRHLTWALPD